jgi:hypothetical protein
MKKLSHRVPSMGMTQMLILLAVVLFGVFFVSNVWKREGMGSEMMGGSPPSGPKKIVLK